MANLPFALQLYSIRDHMDRDVPSTLRQVKEMGYDAVEVAGMHGLSAAAFRDALDIAGLTPISAHIGFEDSALNPANAVSIANALGIQRVAVPWLGGAMCPDREAWRIAARKMGEAGAVLRNEGIQLCFHNHAEEFEAVEGTRPFDLIFDETQPEHLAAEIDTYWVKYAGEDPVDLITRFEGRCPLLHIKDMSASGDRFFAEVGEGIMDWAPIFQAGRAAGTEWFIVEQDESRGDSLESVAISAAFMKRAAA